MGAMSDLKKGVSEAVRLFWRTRTKQAARQRKAGRNDQGARGAVTGGAQMDGFVDLLTSIVTEAGIHRTHIKYEEKLELPGFFRPSKEWDLLVVRDGQLIAAIEVKSQTGPSFGNNFNNRTEEAMGTALDLWTAFKNGALNKSIKPWLGYLFLLEDCAASRSPVRVQEPHFKVFPEFQGASYAKRYELFCRKLMRERLYDGAAFLVSSREGRGRGAFEEPAADLAFSAFAKALFGHAIANRDEGKSR
jgi:hypothetical protein